MLFGLQFSFLRPNRLLQMQDNSSRVKKKYDLNCLIVADSKSSALDTIVNVEEEGFNVLTVASTVSELKCALQEFPLDIILSEEKINGPESLCDIYSNLTCSTPIILFSDVDSKGRIDMANSEKSYVVLHRPYSQDSLKIAIKEALSPRISLLKQTGDIKRKDDTLYIRSSSKLVSVNTNEVSYIKAEGNYCTVHVNSRRYVIRSSISNVLKRIDHEDFVQIHRGFIANISLVHELAISKGRLQIGKEYLPIGRKYKKDLVQLLLK